MELSTFFRVYRRHWFIPAALLAISLLGAFLYIRQYSTYEAMATVAVLDPLTARPGGYAQAQVTFDSVIKSQELANRVAKRLGRDPGAVSGHLSTTIVPSLEAYNLSPVYAVYGRDKNSDSAIAMTNAAAEEGRKLFLEVNAPDPQAIKDALAGQMQAAQDELAAAIATYQQFMSTNDATDLEARIAKQRDIVYSLHLAAVVARADQRGAYASGNTQAGIQAQYRANELEAALGPEQAQLNKLVALELPFGVVSSNIQTAQATVNQLKQYELSTVTGEQLPFTAQIKIIDHAQLQSQLLTKALTIAIAALLGLFAGAGSIYLFALVSRVDETAAEIASAFGAPVLARVPRTT